MFDGVNDNIFIGANLISANTLTIAAWFKQSSVPVTNQWRALVAGDCGAAYLTLDFFQNRPAFGGQCDSPFGMTYASPVTDTNWHHVVATYGGGQVKVYVDGNPPVTSSRGGNFNVGLALYIGAYSAGGGEPFGGSIDEVYLYNRVLNACEVEGVFNEGAPTPTATNTPDKHADGHTDKYGNKHADATSMSGRKLFQRKCVRACRSGFLRSRGGGHVSDSVSGRNISAEFGVDRLCVCRSG